jgi:hypothetical protein
MVQQFFTWKVGFQLGFAAVWAATIWRVSIYVNKGVESRKLNADYLKTPTSNVLTVLGLTVPILVALISYLYTSQPKSDYGSLLSTTTLYFVVLLIAIWETFAILKKAGDDDKLTLTYPADRRFVTGLGLMYGMLILGLIYFASFFLFEVSAPVRTPDTAVAVSANQTLLRRELYVNTTRDEMVRAWGAPARASAGVVEYDSPTSIIKIVFDTGGNIQSISETRR